MSSSASRQQQQQSNGDEHLKLASILSDLGAECCEKATLVDVLTQLGPSMRSKEAQIARALFMMCIFPEESAESQSGTHWSTPVFMLAVREAFPSIDFGQVLAAFDFPHFTIKSPAAAESLISAFKAVMPNFYNSFPVKVLFRQWSNLKGQLAFIYNTLLLAPEFFNYSQFPYRKIISNEDLIGYPAAAKSVASSLLTSTWNCYELLEFTGLLIDTEYFEEVKPIFEMASRQCPELLCIGLASLNPPWNSINKEILVKLTCGFLIGQTSSSVVLPKIWSLNSNTMLVCMAEMHRRDATCLSRLLDVAQELKIINFLLDAKPFSFAIDVASLASRRQHLNLEKWIADSIRDKGQPFLQATVEFVSEKVKFQVKRQRGLQTPPFIPLSNDVLGVFMKVLQGNLSIMSAECLEEFRELQKILGADVSPHELSAAPGATAGGTGVSPAVEFPPDVEEEVNNFFDRIFAREISITDVIEILQKLRASSNPRDQQIFACLINNIFDEYRFFPKYPETELLLTATLFGQLINCQLISYVTLGVALRCVLEALKKPPTQKLFKFGLQALTQFQGRLVEWPQYCAHILQIPGLQQVHPELFNYVRNCLTGAPPPAPSQQAAAPASAGPQKVAAAAAGGDSLTSLNISTLLEAADRQQILVPNEQVRDRILFIVNNVSLMNLESKANDLVKILQEPYYEWMAQYLVIKRACIEPNFHQLYLAFLEVLQLHTLEENILRQTYSNISVLLRSTKTDTSSSERSLLKNLGSWLGGLTLARNRPILFRDISLKKLLLEAYLTNRLIVVIPFVCKVMEQCSRSRVFQPHNPWLMAILSVLVELYHYAELKLNLKFEIEVLCKSIGIELKAIKPSDMIRASSGNGAVRATAANKPEPFEFLPGPEALHSSIPAALAGASFESLLTFNTNIPMLSSSPALKRIVALSVELAIREIVYSVAERAVSVAGNTARTLVLKDFSVSDEMFGGDEESGEIVKQAARQMAQSLAASLALVTSRDPLKPAITHNARAFVQLVGLGNRLSDIAIQTIADDNVDLACAYVERSAMEKASTEIIALLNAETSTRSSKPQQQRMALSLRAALYAEIAGGKTGRAKLPPISMEPITPGELERLTEEVRELTMREPGLAASSNVPDFSIGDDEAMVPSDSATAGLDAFFQSTCVRFIEIVNDIETLVPMASAYGSVSKLPPNHELRNLMKQVIMLASSSPVHRDELCLLMSQRLMQGLYRTEHVLCVDIIILLLLKIFEFSAKAAKEVTSWVVYSTDERKYSVLATAALFGSGLVYVLDFDAQLAKQIDFGKEVAVEFAVNLIRKCVFEEPAVAAPYDFVYTLEALGKVVQRNPSASAATKKGITELMEAISAKVREPQSEPQQLRDQITFCFTDWFRLCQYPSISDKLMASFVGQLYQRDFLRTEASARSFFRTCIEVSVELYMRQRRAPAILAYRSIDAFAKLVGQLLKWRPSGPGLVTIPEIVTNVHLIAGEILIQGFEQGIDYLQRPFGRLFICLANELVDVEKVLPEELNHDLILNIATFYLTINPRLLPQFAFAWLELISHRGFLPRLLFAPKRTDWPVLARLLSEAIAFASPLFVLPEPSEAVSALYRGLLRTLLVIHHDMPEFFVAYHLQFCGLLPLKCHQLRAVILSASPSGISLPNPLRPDLKVDLLPEMAAPPNVHYDYVRILEESKMSNNNSLSLKQELDRALAGSVMIGPFCSDLAIYLEATKNQLLFQNLIFYIAMNGLGAVQSGEAPGVSLGRSTSMAIISGLLDALQSAESRYTLLAFLVDQLRFPNRHTHYFSYVILYLFVEPHTGEAVKEQITRILVERLLAHKPHPWGLLVTFVELVKNAHYRFWEYRFTRATPEVEHILRSITQSCLSSDKTVLTA